MLENESANARFGRLLREFRNSLGLTQEQLALKAGYDRTFISRVERGLSNLTLYSAETLANALGIPLYKFFIESEEKNMPRATKEFVLNYAMNRWQLNFKKNVGPTSELIRSCAPHNFEEWKQYYFNHGKSESHIEKLGKILYEKISTVLPEEERFHPNLLKSISEQDCIDYMFDVVLRRTYEGYMKEHGK